MSATAVLPLAFMLVLIKLFDPEWVLVEVVL